MATAPQGLIDRLPHSHRLNGLRALGERGNALLKTRWAALRRVTLRPRRIGQMARAALVLSTLERGHY